MERETDSETFLLAASTSVRTGERVNGRGEESSGSLILFDLNLRDLSFDIVGEFEIPMSPHFPGRNSVRGFCEFADGIAICNCSQVFLFDKQLRLQRTYSENLMGDVHSVATDGKTLYITATGADSIIGLDRDFNKVFNWHASQSSYLRPYLKLWPMPPRFLETFEFRRNYLDARESFHLNHVTFSFDGDLLCNLPGIGRVFNITRDDFFLPGHFFRFSGGTHDGCDQRKYYYVSATWSGDFLKVAKQTGSVVTAVSCSEPVPQSTGAPSAKLHGWLRGAVHLRDEIFVVGQVGPKIKIVDMNSSRLIATLSIAETPGGSVYSLNHISRDFVPAFRKQSGSVAQAKSPENSAVPLELNGIAKSKLIEEIGGSSRGSGKSVADGITLVTGASTNHFGCLKNLLYSVGVHEAGARTIVYDLGLKNAELKELQSQNCEVRRFPYEFYPPHLNIKVEAGQYAWKPVIVADLLRELKGPVLWLDAGDLVYARLDRIRRLLNRCGVYSPRTSDTITKWTHPLTLQYLRASPDLLPKVNRNGAIVGFNPAFPGVSELAEEWKACALDRDCIAPAGSSRKNHRQDQAVLSVLLYQFAQKYGIALENELLGVSCHHDPLTRDQVKEEISPRINIGIKVSREKEAIGLLVKTLFICHRVGHSSRLMSFSTDGRVGRGVSDDMRFWDIKERDEILFWEFYSRTGLTFALRESASGGWGGRSRDGRHSIELLAKEPLAD